MPDREDPEKVEAPPDVDLAKEKEAAQELASDAAPKEEIIQVSAVAPAAVGAETASTMAFDEKQKQDGDISHLESGVHHWEQYKRDCEVAGKKEKWKDEYRSGHTSAKGWTNPYEHQPYENRNAKTYDWELKHGHSASTALQDWLAGPTIADFRSAAVAKELNELRGELGDQKFDDVCGSSDKDKDKRIPMSQRLRISAAAYGGTMIQNLREIAYEVETHPTDRAEKPLIEPQAAEEKKPDVSAALLEPEVAPLAPDVEHA
jgi:hypothetical protein